MKKYISLLIKIAITVAIFYFMLKDQDFNKFADLYSKSDGLILFASSILILLSIFILSFRWNRINKIFQFKFPQIELYKHYLIAYGFNSFLPSAIGGDIWRIRFLTKQTGRKIDSVVSPFLERITGMIAILCVLPLAFNEFGQYIEQDQVTSFVYLTVFLLLLLFFGLFTQFGQNVLLFVINKMTNDSWIKKLTSLKETLLLIHSNRIRMIEGIVLSIITQFIFTLSCWASFYAFGGSIAFMDFYLVIIIMYIATTLPISLNGFGPREATIIWGLTHFGIEKELAIVVALFISFLTLVPSFVGGAVFLLSKEELKNV